MMENNIENDIAEIKSSEILYAIAETIENGQMMVSASPELWIDGHLLYWPPGPGPANRQNPSPPQADWIPHFCRILKGSIATFEEALELEQRYSAHNDSNSFRKAQAEKQLRRDHPVNANPQLDLIDANSMVNEIDGDDRRATKEADDVVRSEYHKNCHESNESNNANLKSGTLKKKNIGKVVVKETHPVFKRNLKLKSKSDAVKDLKKTALPRYINYLKSGIQQQKNLCTSKKTASASATITKEQYLKQNRIPEIENQDPFSPHTSNFPVKVGDLSKNYTDLQISAGFDNPVNKSSNKFLSKNGDVNSGQFDDFANAGDQVQIGDTMPASSSIPMLTGMSFEERVLRELNELKKDQQKAEEKRVLFEARMEVKWDGLMKGKSLDQGQSQKRYQETDFVDENDDFEDLDENFPITVEENVEN